MKATLNKQFTQQLNMIKPDQDYEMEYYEFNDKGYLLTKHKEYGYVDTPIENIKDDALRLFNEEDICLGNLLVPKLFSVTQVNDINDVLNKTSLRIIVDKLESKNAFEMRKLLNMMKGW